MRHCKQHGLLLHPRPVWCSDGAAIQDYLLGKTHTRFVLSAAVELRLLSCSCMPAHRSPAAPVCELASRPTPLPAAELTGGRSVPRVFIDGKVRRRGVQQSSFVWLSCWAASWSAFLSGERSPGCGWMVLNNSAWASSMHASRSSSLPHDYNCFSSSAAVTTPTQWPATVRSRAACHFVPLLSEQSASDVAAGPFPRMCTNSCSRHVWCVPLYCLSVLARPLHLQASWR